MDDNRLATNRFRFEHINEYDDPSTGEGRRRINGFYRVYFRDTDIYLGIAERLSNPPDLGKNWRVILPNPHYDPEQGPGCYGGAYIGRGTNPKVIPRFGPSRGDVAELLAKHYFTHPGHRLVEHRPECEYGQLVSV